MKQTLFAITLLMISFLSPVKMQAQVNTHLSNLTSPTSINQDLIPNASNARILGSPSRTWKAFYLTGTIYKGSRRFLSNPGKGNTFLGIASGTSMTSGDNNTAFGDSALYATTSCYYNTAVGYMAMSRTSGGGNAAVGWAALRDNTSGFNNVALGYGTLMRNITGAVNIAIGTDALINNTTGSNNIAIGMFSLVNSNGLYNTAIGASSLYNTRASHYNTAVGYKAGFTYNNGYNNVFVGANTDVLGADFYNVIAIGQATVCTAPSQVTMGNPATNSYRAYATWSNISDGRYKKNLKENVPGLAFINKLRPVTYNLDATGLDNFLNRNRTNEDRLSGEAKSFMNKALKEKEKIAQSGFIAQDVEKSALELGYDFSGVEAAKNENDVYGLKYAEFVVPLVKAVQELSKENDLLKNQLSSQQQQIIELKDMVLKLANGRKVVNSALNNIMLGQNAPNPFDHSTSIKYVIPSGFQSAQLVVTDHSGKTIKRVELISVSGTVNIDGSLLNSGGYNYSLIVDGKIVETKKMIAAR